MSISSCPYFLEPITIKHTALYIVITYILIPDFMPLQKNEFKSTMFHSLRYLPKLLEFVKLIFNFVRITQLSRQR